MWPWTKTKQPAKAQTAFGDFEKWEGFWEGRTDPVMTAAGEANLRVLATDVGGEPNPQFLQQVAEIINQLPALEALARDSIGNLSKDHQLDGIVDGCSSAERADFQLDFVYDEEGWGETVFVFFKDGQIMGWGSMD